MRARPKKAINCIRCGTEFYPVCNAAKNCPECSLIAKKERNDRSNRKARMKSQEEKRRKTSGLDRRLNDLRSMGLSYADWQKMKTLEMAQNGR